MYYVWFVCFSINTYSLSAFALVLFLHFPLSLVSPLPVPFLLSTFSFFSSRLCRLQLHKDSRLSNLPYPLPSRGEEIRWYGRVREGIRRAEEVRSWLRGRLKASFLPSIFSSSLLLFHAPTYLLPFNALLFFSLWSSSFPGSLLYISFNFSFCFLFSQMQLEKDSPVSNLLLPPLPSRGDETWKKYEEETLTGRRKTLLPPSISPPALHLSHAYVYLPLPTFSLPFSLAKRKVEKAKIGEN